MAERWSALAWRGWSAALLLAALPTPGAATLPSVARWRPYVDEASRRFGVPIAWIERVMAAESGGRTSWQGRPITSRAGAMGLMQLMPATWAAMRRTHRLGPDPHDPRDNILAGTAYLHWLHVRFGYPGLFAAYNAGPTRYAAHLATGRSLPRETRAYLASVGGRWTPAVTAARTASALFFSIGAGERRHDRLSPTAAGLFVPLGRAPVRSD